MALDRMSAHLDDARTYQHLEGPLSTLIFSNINYSEHFTVESASCELCFVGLDTYFKIYFLNRVINAILAYVNAREKEGACGHF